MYASSLAVDQRTCPSFVSLRGGSSAQSHLEVLNAMPLSLRTIALDVVTPHREGSRSLFSPSSRRRRSGSKGIEALLQRAALAVERKEDVRVAAVQRELSQCTAVPRISTMARSIPRDTDIVDRLERVHKEKQIFDEIKRLRRQQEEEQVMARWFAPNITRRGHCTESRALRAAEEFPHQQKKLQRERAQLAEAEQHCRLMEIGDICSSPRINPRSAAIAQCRKEREGLDGLSHVDAMLERDRLAKLALWERQQERIRSEFSPSSPPVAAIAISSRRGNSVVNRLMADTKERHGRLFRDAMGAKSEPHARRRSYSGSFLRRDTFHHRQQSLNRQLRHQLHDEDEKDLRLLSMEERQRLYKERRERKIHAILEAEKRLHTPNIDAVSEMIAASLPLSSNERLMTAHTRRHGGITREEHSGKLGSSRDSPWIGTNGAAQRKNPNGHNGPEEYVSPIKTPRQEGRKTPLVNDKGDIYQRMRRWQQLRNDKVQRLREELKERQELQASELRGRPQCPPKDMKNPLSFSAKMDGEILSAGRKNPPVVGVGTEGSRTPLVLSLMSRYLVNDEGDDDDDNKGGGVFF